MELSDAHSRRPSLLGAIQASKSWRALTTALLGIAPGAAVTVTAAVLSWGLSNLIHAPAMLLALLLGMGLNPLLARQQAFTLGLTFSGRTILRLGVILLGARVTIGEIASLGAPTLALAAGAAIVTIAGGWLLGRAIGLRSDHAVLSAGAVAICGASAALAISAVLPRRAESDRNTMLTIIGVTALSTVAMVIYPSIAQGLGLDERTAGVFLGASIHDVAQVVGAGFMISENAAEVATIVKLTRVACLAPMVLVLGLLWRTQQTGSARTKSWPIPGFLLGFLALMSVASLGIAPREALTAAVNASQWCLLAAVAAARRANLTSGHRGAWDKAAAGALSPDGADRRLCAWRRADARPLKRHQVQTRCRKMQKTRLFGALISSAHGGTSVSSGSIS